MESSVCKRNLVLDNPNIIPIVKVFNYSHDTKIKVVRPIVKSRCKREQITVKARLCRYGPQRSVWGSCEMKSYKTHFSYIQDVLFKQLKMQRVKIFC
jgi:hypothetical protein